jgi:GDPmannose 4,6-dehydratase
MKKVIITGITGQDGSYMADFILNNTDHIVYGVRRSSNPNLQNISHNLDHPRFKIVIGDLSDSNSIDELVKEIRPDYFINFAPQAFVVSNCEILVQTFDATAVGVLRCLEAIRKYSPNCRFFSAGSSEEMGDVLYSPQDLEHPISPRSPYGAAKAAARHITKIYRKSYNLFAIHSILYNHESERRGEEFVTRKITKNIARILKSIKNNQEFEPLQLGNLDAKRDWSHAQDFIEAVWLMLNQNKPREYILSSGEAHAVREFVEKAFKAANINEFNWTGEKENEQLILSDHFIKEKNIKSKTLVKINSKFYRPGEVNLLLGDPSKTRSELKWCPKISFDNLVKRMVEHDIEGSNI